MNSELAIHGGQPVRREPFPTWPVFGVEEEKELIATVRSGKWGKLDGSQVAEFEKRWAKYCGVKHAIGVCNGTISLQIALLAAGIQAGDEVIVPPYTFLATATAVVACNATPVFVDVELDSFNIDPAKIEAAITPRTRAIIPVHFGGIACDMEAINNIAHKHKLIVIEDAAHAHGSEYKTRRAGSLADIGSFSFQSSKNLTCGEGGIITTNDDRLAGLCRSIHNCGRIPQGAWYEHHLMSGNFRLGEFQGAVLNRQFDRLDEQTDTRDRNGKYLDQELMRIPGIRPQKRVAAVTRSAYHLYCFRFDQQAFGIERARFIEAMNKEGIPVSGGYILPLNEQPLFAKKSFGPYTGYTNARPDVDYGNAGMTNCQRLCTTEACWLTQNVMLGTRADMDDIVRAIRKVYDNRGALAESTRSTVGAAG